MMLVSVMVDRGEGMMINGSGSFQESAIIRHRQELYF